MKFNKITIVILSVSIIALSTGLVLISQNVAYGGAPGILGGISANPGSTISNKGTQYAIVVEPATNGGLVKSVVVTFPVGTTVPANAKVSVATLNNQGLAGTTSIDGTARTVTFTLTTATTMNTGDKLFLFIQKVLNPTVTGSLSTSLTVETRDSGGFVIDGPTSVPFGIQEVLTPGAIKADNTNFKVGIGNNITPDETLTVGGNIKLSGNIVSSGPIKIIPTGDICIGTGC